MQMEKKLDLEIEFFFNCNKNVFCCLNCICKISIFCISRQKNTLPVVSPRRCSLYVHVFAFMLFLFPSIFAQKLTKKLYTNIIAFVNQSISF